MNHFHNYQAKSLHPCHVHSLLQILYNLTHQQILLTCQLPPPALHQKHHHSLHFQVHPFVALVVALFSGHHPHGVDQKPALSTNGPPLCLEALKNDPRLNKPRRSPRPRSTRRRSRSAHGRSSPPPRQRDRFQLRSCPRSATPPGHHRPRSASRRRHEPVRFKETHHSLLLDSKIKGWKPHSKSHRPDPPSWKQETPPTGPKRAKGPRSTRAGEELYEGEVYLDSVRIRMIPGAGRYPHWVKAANELAESLEEQNR